MNAGNIPKFEERRGRTLEKYTGHSFSGLEISIELTENEIYLGFKDPIPYSEITGIYRKIKENPDSEVYLDVFTGSSQWFRIYGPDQGLADSIIKGVTGAKKKAEHNNNMQTDINNIASKIKEAMEEEHGTDKEIKIIPQNTAFYSFREVASNGQGPKSKKTWLDIYNIETQNTECPIPEITYQYFNRKTAIQLMTGKI